MNIYVYLISHPAESVLK